MSNNAQTPKNQNGITFDTWLSKAGLTPEDGKRDPNLFFAWYDCRSPVEFLSSYLQKGS